MYINIIPTQKKLNSTLIQKSNTEKVLEDLHTVIKLAN
jgi:hypothetical protein